MGLDGFLSIIRKKYPSVLINEHISNYAYNYVFLDISSYIYKYICIFGNKNPQWISSMLQLFLTLQVNKVNIVPVFDGKPPDAKKDEIDERKEKREKIKDKIKTIEKVIEKIKENISLSEEEQKITEEILTKIKEKEQTVNFKRLLSLTSSVKPDIKDESNKKFTENDINDLQQHISNIQKQMVYIGKREIDILKDLLNTLGIRFMTAPEESEAYCCYMVKNGYGSAVISCDTDCFAHGAKTVILNFDPKTAMIEKVNLDQLLQELGLSHKQFVDYAILIGCDYNKKNTLPKVGPVKALELIKKFGSIDNIEGYDISILNHQHIRTLFNPEYKPMKKLTNKKVNKDALIGFIEEHNLRLSYERIESMIKIINLEPNIVFSD